MCTGRTARRIVFGIAGAIPVTVLGSGCQQPLLRPRTPVATSANAPVAQVIPAEVSQDAPLYVSAPATPTAQAPRVPTPLLDAIAERAKGGAKVDVVALVDNAKPEVKSKNDPPAPEVTASPPIVLPSQDAEPSDKEPVAVDSASSHVDPSDTVKDKNQLTAKVDAPPEPPQKPEPPAPQVVWRDGLEQLRELARGELGKGDPLPGNWTLRLALLDWMSGNVGDQRDTLWRTLLAPFSHASLPNGAERAAEVRSAVDALEAMAPLEITELKLCRKVTGFGSYETLEPIACKAGRAVIVYCEMSGVRYEAVSEGYRSRLSAEVELRPVDNGKPPWKHDLGLAEDCCRKRRRDYYVNYRLDLPEDLPAGPYELRLTQTDLVTNQTHSNVMPMTVVR